MHGVDPPAIAERIGSNYSSAADATRLNANAVPAAVRRVHDPASMRSSTTRDRFGRPKAGAMTTDRNPPVAAPLPEVVTDRLVLRRFEPSDLDELARVFAHEEVWRFPYGARFDVRETERFLASRSRNGTAAGSAAGSPSTGSSAAVIGYVGLWCRRFSPRSCRRSRWDGASTRRTGARGWRPRAPHHAREAFETLELDEVTSVPQADNAPSARVCERLGNAPRAQGRESPRTRNEVSSQALLYTITTTSGSRRDRVAAAPRPCRAHHSAQRERDRA